MLRPAPFPLTHRASQRIASHGITTPAQHQQKPPGPQQIARRKQGLPVGPTSLTPPPSPVDRVDTSAQVQVVRARRSAGAAPKTGPTTSPVSVRLRSR